MDTHEFDRILHDGLPHWRHLPTGRLLPVVAGGDGPEGDGGEGDGNEGGDDDGTEGGTQTVTMTQADLDRLVGRRASEAKRAAERDLKAYLEAEKAKADEATLGEVERAKAEAARLQREADDAKAQAARERLDARIERRLLRAGVPDTAIERAMRTVVVADDATDDDITAEIDQLKKDLPALFTNDQAPPPPGGKTTGKPPANTTTGKTFDEIGREAAAAAGWIPATN